MITTKQQVVHNLIRNSAVPTKEMGVGFAPTNIALCKYWGKRNTELNLPYTGSLSISLGHLGACTNVSLSASNTDQITLNDQIVADNTVFYRRVVEFLDLVRPTRDTVFTINTKTNIPVASGLASSACGFAALVTALSDFFAWPLSLQELSILARLGSGSACRSFWHGFVEWHVGQQADGMDSFAEHLNYDWPDLRVGLILIDSREKPTTSRAAMQMSVETSPFYSVWPKVVETALRETHAALAAQDFWSLGTVAEANSLAMHAIMLSTTPAIIYTQAATLECMQQVWRARAEGLAIFFTQDAGPNLKILFQSKDEARVRELFATIQIVAPFAVATQTVECFNER